MAIEVSVAETGRGANALPDTQPILSTRDRQPLARPVSGLMALAGIGGLIAPDAFIAVAGAGLVAAVAAMIGLRAMLVASASGRARRDAPPATAAGAGDCLPAFSVLVPLYREAASVPALVSALEAIDYPEHLLDIIFLTEADDPATRAALSGAGLPEHWSVLVLPDGAPRTKPRALNVGLGRTRGSLVTVYDAEDRPHPGQIRAAVAAFRADTSGRLACVQAPLRAHNVSQGWLAAQWGLEYDIQFGLILPALAQAQLPMALGGTSNHFCKDALVAAGGWDAWNVTEDADLGLRLARLGWTTGVISPPTLEEAPETLGIWTRQRSRWIKGYMQTFGVLMREPGQTARQLGLRGSLASGILLGGAILSALLHGPLALWGLACLIVPGMSFSPVSLAVLLAGYLVSAAAALAAPKARGVRRLWLVLTLPAYWPLQSVAAVRAAWELVRQPHYWAKTPHALTQHHPAETLAAFT